MGEEQRQAGVQLSVRYGGYLVSAMPRWMTVPFFFSALFAPPARNMKRGMHSVANGNHRAKKAPNSSEQQSSSDNQTPAASRTPTASMSDAEESDSNIPYFFPDERPIRFTLEAFPHSG